MNLGESVGQLREVTSGRRDGFVMHLEAGGKSRD